MVKLHTKLGKPIPSTDPVVVGNSTTKTTTSTNIIITTTSTQAKTGTAVPKVVSGGVVAKKAVTSAPKINFVAGMCVVILLASVSIKFTQAIHMK